MAKLNQHRGYVIAIGAVLVALLLMLLLDPYLNFSQASFLLFFGAVIVAAFYGGRGPAVLATLLAALFARYFFLTPQYSLALTLPAGLRLLLFVTQGLLISVFVGSSRLAQLQTKRSLERLQATEAEVTVLNQQLQQRVDELQTLFQVIPVGIAIAEDPKCQVIRANSFFQKIFNITADANLSVTGAKNAPIPVKRLQNGKEIPIDELPMQVAAKGTEVRNAEIQIVRPDGATFDLLGSAVPLQNQEGDIRGSVAVFMDISDRKRAEAELRLITDTVPALIAYVDRDCRYRFVNQTFTSWFGQPVEQIIGQTVEAFVGESNYQYMRQDIETALAGHSVTNELWVPFHQGGSRYILRQYVPDISAQGEVKGLYAFITDITDLKLAETALRRSEERFRVAQEISLDAFIILQTVRDITGTILDFEWIYANPKATALLSRSMEALIGQRLLEVLPDDKTGRELFESCVDVVETGNPSDTERLYSSEGGSRWFRSMVVKLNDGVAISFSDITSRKQAEQEREQLLERERAAREQAETANQIKDDFLAVLSHELRSPLNPILGWAKILQSQKLNDSTMQLGLEVIERNAKLQTQLIDDLLDISRILRGKLNLNVAVVDLVETIEAALETVRLAAEAKSIQIETRLDPEVGGVLGDAARLQQVLWNLLSNAIKFSSANGRVEVTLTYSGDSSSAVQIQVSDSGKGIHPDFLPHIFDTFRQADSSITRKFGGLGLGLAIVRRLVELHGGTVWAESPGEGKGTTVTVRLPLLVAAKRPTDHPAALDSAQFAGSDNFSQVLQGLKILAVDDEADMRNYLAFVLELAGARVTLAASAKEAIAAFSEAKPDLLISDIGMPEVDGYTLLQQLRSTLPHSEQIPAIALTAYVGELNQQQALAAGFQQHVGKPIEPHNLIEAIAKLMGRNTV
ncbi:PAS domain-containing protein [Phormidium tenue FACHB-886]|nr:PAS domain-containing protein [Phormidium tenue FACHB-886]